MNDGNLQKIQTATMQISPPTISKTTLVTGNLTISREITQQSIIKSTKTVTRRKEATTRKYVMIETEESFALIFYFVINFDCTKLDLNSTNYNDIQYVLSLLQMMLNDIKQNNDTNQFFINIGKKWGTKLTMLLIESSDKFNQDSFVILKQIVTIIFENLVQSTFYLPNFCINEDIQSSYEDLCGAINNFTQTNPSCDINQLFTALKTVTTISTQEFDYSVLATNIENFINAKRILESAIPLIAPKDNENLPTILFSCNRILALIDHIISEIYSYPRTPFSKNDLSYSVRDILFNINRYEESPRFPKDQTFDISNIKKSIESSDFSNLEEISKSLFNKMDEIHKKIKTGRIIQNEILLRRSIHHSLWISKQVTDTPAILVDERFNNMPSFADKDELTPIEIDIIEPDNLIPQHFSSITPNSKLGFHESVHYMSNILSQCRDNLLVLGSNLFQNIIFAYQWQNPLIEAGAIINYLFSVGHDATEYKDLYEWILSAIQIKIEGAKDEKILRNRFKSPLLLIKRIMNYSSLLSSSLSQVISSNPANVQFYAGWKPFFDEIYLSHSKLDLFKLIPHLQGTIQNLVMFIQAAATMDIEIPGFNFYLLSASLHYDLTQLNQFVLQFKAGSYALSDIIEELKQLRHFLKQTQTEFLLHSNDLACLYSLSEYVCFFSRLILTIQGMPELSPTTINLIIEKLQIMIPELSKLPSIMLSYFNKYDCHQLITSIYQVLWKLKQMIPAKTMTPTANLFSNISYSISALQISCRSPEDHQILGEMKIKIDEMTERYNNFVDESESDAAFVRNLLNSASRFEMDPNMTIHAKKLIQLCRDVLKIISPLDGLPVSPLIAVVNSDDRPLSDSRRKAYKFSKSPLRKKKPMSMGHIHSISNDPCFRKPILVDPNSPIKYKPSGKHVNWTFKEPPRRPTTPIHSPSVGAVDSDLVPPDPPVAPFYGWNLKYLRSIIDIISAPIVKFQKLHNTKKIEKLVAIEDFVFPAAGTGEISSDDEHSIDACSKQLSEVESGTVFDKLIFAERTFYRISDEIVHCREDCPGLKRITVFYDNLRQDLCQFSGFLTYSELAAIIDDRVRLIVSILGDYRSRTKKKDVSEMIERWHTFFMKNTTILHNIASCADDSAVVCASDFFTNLFRAVSAMKKVVSQIDQSLSRTALSIAYNALLPVTQQLNDLIYNTEAQTDVRLYDIPVFVEKVHEALQRIDAPDIKNYIDSIASSLSSLKNSGEADKLSNEIHAKIIQPIVASLKTEMNSSKENLYKALVSFRYAIRILMIQNEVETPDTFLSSLLVRNKDNLNDFSLYLNDRAKEENLLPLTRIIERWVAHLHILIIHIDVVLKNINNIKSITDRYQILSDYCIGAVNSLVFLETDAVVGIIDTKKYYTTLVIGLQATSDYCDSAGSEMSDKTESESDSDSDSEFLVTTNRTMNKKTYESLKKISRFDFGFCPQVLEHNFTIPWLAELAKVLSEQKRPSSSRCFSIIKATVESIKGSPFRLHTLAEGPSATEFSRKRLNYLCLVCACLGCFVVFDAQFSNGKKPSLRQLKKYFQEMKQTDFSQKVELDEFDYKSFFKKLRSARKHEKSLEYVIKIQTKFIKYSYEMAQKLMNIEEIRIIKASDEEIEKLKEVTDKLKNPLLSRRKNSASEVHRICALLIEYFRSNVSDFSFSTHEDKECVGFIIEFGNLCTDFKLIATCISDNIQYQASMSDFLNNVYDFFDSSIKVLSHGTSSFFSYPIRASLIDKSLRSLCTKLSILAQFDIPESLKFEESMGLFLRYSKLILSVAETKNQFFNSLYKTFANALLAIKNTSVVTLSRSIEFDLLVTILFIADDIYNLLPPKWQTLVEENMFSLSSSMQDILKHARNFVEKYPSCVPKSGMIKLSLKKAINFVCINIAPI